MGEEPTTQDRKVRISLIAAMDQDGVIGADGGMPWHLPDDLRWFKRNTRGKAILMGRRTFGSIGHALAGRRNLVLTRDNGFSAPGVEVVTRFAQALTRVPPAAELMVIGGAQIYALALPQADRLLITRIEARYSGDTWFPSVDWSQWRLISQETSSATAATPAHRFMTYQRLVG